MYDRYWKQVSLGLVMPPLYRAVNTDVISPSALPYHIQIPTVPSQAPGAYETPIGRVHPTLPQMTWDLPFCSPAGVPILIPVPRPDRIAVDEELPTYDDLLFTSREFSDYWQSSRATALGAAMHLNNYWSHELDIATRKLQELGVSHERTPPPPNFFSGTTSAFYNPTEDPRPATTVYRPHMDDIGAQEDTSQPGPSTQNYDMSDAVNLDDVDWDFDN